MPTDYSNERKLLAESVAQYLGFSETPLQHVKELQRYFPRTRNDLESSVGAFAYAYVSDQNYPADDGTGAVARSYVTNPTASDNTYAGTWRHVSTTFDAKRNGWIQILRFGWATSVLTAGAPNDEAFLIEGNYPLSAPDVRTLEWRNIDPASVQFCQAELRTKAYFTDPVIQGCALTSGTWGIGSVVVAKTDDGSCVIRATISRVFTLTQTISDDASNTVTREDNQNVRSPSLTVASGAGYARQGSVEGTGNGLYATSLTTDTAKAIIESGIIYTAGGARYWWRGRNASEAQKDAALTAAGLDAATLATPAGQNAAMLTDNHVDVQLSDRYPARWNYYIVKSPNRIYLWEESVSGTQVKWERQDGHIWDEDEARNIKAYRYLKVSYTYKICHSEKDAESYIDGGLDGSRVVGYGGMGYKGIKVTEIKENYTETPSSSPAAPATAGWHTDETWAT